MYEKLLAKIYDLIPERREASQYYTARVLQESADAIEDLQKKVTEWQEEACKWNNEYFALRDSMSRWISVKERLPEEQQDVLVYLKRGGCAVDYFIPSRNDKWGYKDVTHWQPLPAPPKEDEA